MANMAIVGNDSSSYGSRFALKDEYRPLLSQSTQGAKNAGGLLSRLFDDDVLNGLAVHVGARLPQLMDIDHSEMLERLQSGLQAALPAAIAKHNRTAPADRRIDARAQVHRVSLEERVGAGGLIPIGIGAGVVTGTQIVFSASSFQGVSVFRKCRMAFNDATGALLIITQFSIGTNNRFAIANSAFPAGYIGSAARFREQHAAFQPGDGFSIGTLQLDNSTQISVTGTVLTGTAAGTSQIFCTIYGVPDTLPSGYTGDDCACEVN